MIACKLCGRALITTPSGLLCEEHGGAPPTEERPDDETLEAAQRMSHLHTLRAHVEAGGALDRANTLWLLELAGGGMWGRWCARAMADLSQHRQSLRELVRALLTKHSETWTRANWRPIIELLRPRANDADPPLPNLERLDCGFVMYRHVPAQAGRIVIANFKHAAPAGQPFSTPVRYTSQCGGSMDVHVEMTEEQFAAARVIEAGELHE